MPKQLELLVGQQVSYEQAVELGWRPRPARGRMTFAPLSPPRRLGCPGKQTETKRRSIERRRRLASCWPVPPHLAGHFTQCQLAALRIVADEIKRHGYCDLFIDKIAALAGTCRTIVRYALRKAKDLRLLTVEERPRRGQKSLTNIVRGLCKDWLRWIGLRILSSTAEAFSKSARAGRVERTEEDFRGGESQDSGHAEPP